jgi:hypothetical protein
MKRPSLTLIEYFTQRFAVPARRFAMIDDGSNLGDKNWNGESSTSIAMTRTFWCRSLMASRLISEIVGVGQRSR